ncbi:MAG: hypothetical protein IJT21_07325 [Synergistaceae bacterium]|nr:hypothetical protein [Synergistaceae bacterium]
MNNVKNFVQRWQGRGNEKSDTQSFWNQLLRDVLNVDYPDELINFEKSVTIEHVGFIDVYIPSTRTLIEQKSFDINLDKAFTQSDGSLLTPYQQAKRYSDWLPDSERARWIIVCNFQKFIIYDMERPKAPPAVLLLDELSRDYNKLSFIIDPKGVNPHDVREEELSVKAGQLVGKLRDSLLERYINPENKSSAESLNIFCVRIVFLLYAEDSGLFAKSQFHDYLKSRELTARDSLRKLFSVLNQKENERDPYLESDLKAFKHVNGGLFADDNIELPQLDGEPLRIILHDMSEGFDWSGISPTIFGAVFESTLNPETRHSGGMHYTSVDNIHKVIDPLFLDELNEEFNAIINISDSGKRTKELQSFQKKLSSLTFFDPACGSGNFLTESYLSLRRLENRILSLLSKQISFADSKDLTPIQISISQFYGIEINDFAVSVARTALWIAEAQMWNETKNLIHFYGDLLPLKSYNNIIEANALRIDWRTVIDSRENLYIMGNPPFLGYSIQSHEQKNDILSVFVDESGKTYRASGKIDYVAGWYFKAAEFIRNTRVKAAFVSTNSITQGEQVSAIFKPLHERFGINIDFAYQSFIWDSETEDKDKAHVHVVIIGFDAIKESGRMRRLFTPEGVKLVNNINFYLVEGENIFIESRQNPVCKDAKFMRRGSQPTDKGNLILTHDAMCGLVAANPTAKKFIRPFMMGADFIQRKPRYCLWLVNANPDDIMRCPKVLERVKRVREFRLESKKEATKRKAETPTLFDEIVECSTNYIAIPVVSSENRIYIPMGWLDNSVIPGNKLLIIPGATLYDFGILTSRVHMAWMRRVCGRLKSDYSYSNTIVYNNFIWPSPNESQRAKIESTAQKILDARKLYPDSSFAALYNDLLMPAELRKAHRENDNAVCGAYGWPADITESGIISELFAMYKALKTIK